MRVSALALVLVLLVGFVAAAPASQASHWCNETFVLVTPTVVTSGVGQTFVIQLTNEGADVTQLTSVQVRFAWETNPRSLGTGTLNPNSPELFTVTTSSVPAGVHAVTITFIGTSDGDPPGSPVTCTADLAIQAIGAGGLFGGVVALLLIVLAIVVIVVVVIVVIVVVVSRKKKGSPPPPPQTAAPPYYPPQAPPPGPPTAPPPSNP